MSLSPADMRMGGSKWQQLQAAFGMEGRQTCAWEAATFFGREQHLSLGYSTCSMLPVVRQKKHSSTEAAPSPRTCSWGIAQ
eukprot:1160889-Pelagomonas_calceolata.AAC.2